MAFWMQYQLGNMSCILTDSAQPALDQINMSDTSVHKHDSNQY